MTGTEELFVASIGLAWAGALCAVSFVYSGIWAGPLKGFAFDDRTKTLGMYTLVCVAAFAAVRMWLQAV